MWAVYICKEILIVMKTREQARAIAKEFGGTVRKGHVSEA